MPTTITSTTGSAYHLWQLPDESAPEPSISKSVTRLKNELSHGYQSSRLLGLQSGLRRWELQLPTLAGTGVSPAINDLFGNPTTRLGYVQALVAYNQVSGSPFGYQWPTETGQYYLVDVVNTPTYTKKKGVNIWSTSLQLRERRITGQTVFDVGLIPSFTRYNYDWFDQTGHSTHWVGSHGALQLTKNGDVVLGSNLQNGLATVRLNGSANTGYLTNNTGDWATPIKEIWIVMKMRENTFSNAAGILTTTSGSLILVGSSGNTKFANSSVIGLEYSLNGVSLGKTNMQAPMNEWGIVQVRFANTGMTGTIQFGRNGSTAGTYAKADIAEIISSAALIPQDAARELHTHLAVKWGFDI